jgi:hypothetical protein
LRRGVVVVFRKIAFVALVVCLGLMGCSGELPPSTPAPSNVGTPTPSPSLSETPQPTTTTPETSGTLLASIPEMDIYAYAYVRERENERDIIDYDIYLEVGNIEPLWLYARPLARSVFRFYYGKFFDDNRNYLIFVDYEHGGHGGGSEHFMVFDGECYSIIPVKHMPATYQLSDDNHVIITFGNCDFEISIDKLTASYKHGSVVVVEDNCLVSYIYFHIDDLYDGSNPYAPQLTVCFRREYILSDGEIIVGTLTFVEDEEYYSEGWDGIFR